MKLGRFQARNLGYIFCGVPPHKGPRLHLAHPPVSAHGPPGDQSGSEGDGREGSVGVGLLTTLS